MGKVLNDSKSFSKAYLALHSRTIFPSQTRGVDTGIAYVYC